MAISDAQSGAKIPYGAEGAVIELAESGIKKGDALGYSGGWKRALATAGSVIQMRCVAGNDGESGEKITGYFGTCLLGGRLSGGTAGAALYVAEGSDNGKYTETAPTTSNDADKIVGYMLTATLAALTPNANADSLAA
jgi:hypothetical protein